MLVVLVLHQRRSRAPLVERSLFAGRRFPAALVTSALFFTATSGRPLVLALHEQLDAGVPGERPRRCPRRTGGDRNRRRVVQPGVLHRGAARGAPAEIGSAAGLLNAVQHSARRSVSRCSAACSSTAGAPAAYRIAIALAIGAAVMAGNRRSRFSGDAGYRVS
ncbi:hypothetical protein [Amycolatopsis thermoflava]|uniref:hypothetical protein n=1 Tax=Amycolatopsis thermoflava TaxID=84480 RepID=UPI003D7104C3